MSPRARCLAGDPTLVGALVDACLGPPETAAPGAASAELLRDRPGRSQLHRVKLASGEILVVKRFLVGGHRHRRRERIKAAWGRSPAQREARALIGLAAAGIAVPELRALAITGPRGDLLLATRHVAGERLGSVLAAGERLSRSALRQIGAAVGALHAAGFVHGDLHAGNILLTRAGPVLIDLQSARRSRSASARRDDLAFLEHSLAPWLSTPDRLRLRAAALGLAAPFDGAARSALRAVGRRAESRRRAFARRRTRRSGVAGARAAAFACAAGRGLRAPEIAPEIPVTALGAACSDDAAGFRTLKRGARTRVCEGPTARGRAVVKVHHGVGTGRALADALRGSPARRAWLAGHGLRLRGVGAAAPWAYVEERRFCLPRRSASVVEAIADATPADACPARVARPEEVAGALLGLLLRLHRGGIDHGDLKASHVLLVRRGNALECRLVDLESLRFRRRLSDGQRIRALAQLNASLPDAFPDALRRWVFDRYAARLPFRVGRAAALRRVVAQSLARRHRWSGGPCAGASRLSD